MYPDDPLLYEFSWEFNSTLPVLHQLEGISVLGFAIFRSPGKYT
jgi:hypothetical protein